MEEAVLLHDALAVVRQQTQLMRKCLETPGKLMDALKCSSTLVSELRTSSLGPKKYYELYMAVFDALRHLSIYLRENHPVNHLADLYELVQYAGNIVPRLYLMVTVGTVYMSIPDAPVKEIMKDMMEMCRGVQHPVRGLFLRYYLSQQARDWLPTGNGDGLVFRKLNGNFQDSISFIITNFIEMNKLWVRLQHQGHSRERDKRTQERKELQLLVGSNLVRLSQLVDLETYKNIILPPLLEQVVQCRDVLAQEYLLEVITQVFPDEFHLHTLDAFLSATARLNPNVNVKAIVIGLMDRLSAYATRESLSESPEERLRKEEEAAQKLLERLSLAEGGNQSRSQTPEQPKPSTEPYTLDGSSSRPPSANGDTKEPESLETGEPSTDTEGENAESAPEHKESPKPAKGIPDNIKLYEIFYEQMLNLVNVRAHTRQFGHPTAETQADFRVSSKAQNLPIQDITALLVSLANLALKIYPERLEYVDQVLKYTNQKVTEMANSADLHSPACQQHILNLMLAPIKSYVSLFTVLSLPSYLPLLHAQSYPTRRSVANVIVQSILKNQINISTPENAEGVFNLVRVLIREGQQQPAGYPGVQSRRTGRDLETDETMEEQGLLARMVHLLYNEKNEIQFQLLQAAKKAFNEGGDRIRYTTPALVTSSIKLARRFKEREHYDHDWSTMSTALYKFMHALISGLYQRVGAADLALRLFLFCGQVADQCEFEEVAYEFFAQAFTVYEEAISDSRVQFQAVAVIANALHSTRNFSKENYDNLITKCALHGSKLLKKPDQCRAVYLASHLWWAVEIPARNEDEKTPLYRDGKRVLECLQRALRVADACMDQAVSIELFVEILNRYVYYFDRQNEAVTVKYLNGLIELIHSNLASSDGSTTEMPRKHFERTLEYIASREFEGVILDPK
ncbi:vacuolar protein sorting-associated protein 35 [Sphaerosporella brunnea]|uniref:Vacuolar protein sorting-associated protein 35 n=1 Tax=Sphaerosporella brunnea TaxID=1250544 RepID=A0A5J5F9T3_9PEZI|nr:vacuolar protein sorting-associated protein 35 [Sphaerosporella brunnea]